MLLFGLWNNAKIISDYQKYINNELRRGLNRNGSGYKESYDLYDYDASEIEELEIKEPKAPKPKFVKL